MATKTSKTEKKQAPPTKLTAATRLYDFPQFGLHVMAENPEQANNLIKRKLNNV